MANKTPIKGKIKKHFAENTTNKPHLDHPDAKLRRKENFPVGSACTLEPAEFVGNVLILMAANNKGDIDYFDSRELELLNPSVLYTNSPELFKYKEDFKMSFNIQ